MRSSVTVAVILCLSTFIIAQKATGNLAAHAAAKPAPAPSTKPPYKVFKILRAELLSAHDTYIGARRFGEGGSQVFTSTNPGGDWEKLWLVYLMNGKVAIKTWWNTFLYLPGKGNGLLAINSGTLNEEQLFDMVDNEDGTWSFKSVVYGNFINVQPGTSENKVESYINKGPWTRFRVHLA